MSGSKTRVRPRARRPATVVLVALLTALMPVLASNGTASAASTFTVNSTGVAQDVAPGDGACATFLSVCTLRAAIEEANALPGLDTILFNLPVGSSRISTESAPLPSLTEPVVIDGTGSPGMPRIDAYRSSGSAMNGLQFDPGSDRSTVRGLEIVRAGKAGIALFSDENVVVGNFIGTTATSAGTCSGGATSGCGNNKGVEILNSSGNLIGGSSAGDRNVISNNATGVSVAADAGPATGNAIRGNHIC
jgi:hypothetical protein